MWCSQNYGDDLVPGFSVIDACSDGRCEFDCLGRVFLATGLKSAPLIGSPCATINRKFNPQPFDWTIKFWDSGWARLGKVVGVPDVLGAIYRVGAGPCRHTVRVDSVELGCVTPCQRRRPMRIIQKVKNCGLVLVTGRRRERDAVCGSPLTQFVAPVPSVSIAALNCRLGRSATLIFVAH